MSRPINLAQFVAAEQKRLERFVAYWERFRRVHPKDFPARMSPGDWDLQFIDFDGQQDEPCLCGDPTCPLAPRDSTP